MKQWSTGRLAGEGDLDGPLSWPGLKLEGEGMSTLAARGFDNQYQSSGRGPNLAGRRTGDWRQLDSILRLARLTQDVVIQKVEEISPTFQKTCNFWDSRPYRCRTSRLRRRTGPGC